MRSSTPCVADVFLLALHVGDVARELLVGAAQLGHVAAQRLELAVQLEHAAPQLLHLLEQRRVGLGQLGVGRVLLGARPVHSTAAQLEDGLARLVVLEQRRLRARQAPPVPSQPPQRPAATQHARRGRFAALGTSPVLQLGAAVLGPGRFVVALAGRPLLAVAHRLDLAVAWRPAASSTWPPPRRGAGRAPGCTRGRRARRCGPRSPSSWSWRRSARARGSRSAACTRRAARSCRSRSTPRAPRFAAARLLAPTSTVVTADCPAPPGRAPPAGAGPRHWGWAAHRPPARPRRA